MGRETDCVLTAIAVISNSCPLPILYSEGLCLHCLPHDLPSKTHRREGERAREAGRERGRERGEGREGEDIKKKRKSETEHWTVEKEIAKKCK